MRRVTVKEGERGKWWYGSGRLRSTTPGFVSKDEAVNDALEAFAGQALEFVDGEGDLILQGR